MMRTASSLLLGAAVCFVGCSKPEPAPPPATAAAAPAARGTVSGTVAAPASTMAAAAAAPAAAQPAAIASADGETSGVRADVTELKRSSGGTVTLKITLVNDSDKGLSFGYAFVDPSHEIKDFSSVGGIHLIDPIGKKKYFVARDTDDKCVCSQNVKDVGKGGRVNVWAKFPAPPDDVEKISIVIPHFSPLDDVPLAR